jgi:hypothetical protein
MQGNAFRAATDPAVHFRGALVTSAIATENLRLPGAIGAGGHCRSVLRHLIVASVEQRAWEIALFSRRSFQSAPVGSSSFLASVQFAAGSGKQYNSGPFYYQATDINLPYLDLDFEDLSLPQDQRGGVLHLMLVNRSPENKSAGDAGLIEIVTYLEPTYG